MLSHIDHTDPLFEPEGIPIFTTVSMNLRGTMNVGTSHPHFHFEVQNEIEAANILLGRYTTKELHDMTIEEMRKDRMKKRQGERL